MAKWMPALDNDGGLTLKDVRVAIIEVECTVCDRRGSHDRAALVKVFGTGVSFARLRRRAAMGCERLNGPDGDRCGTRFPCLEAFKSQ
ncbi:hypothetical protein [Rhizobium sp. NFR07]|uniref:hypothetical protein n=1 Tax=Rhizobium sp. NFR07 TaxID=1566262 RepID=UPI003296BFAB